MLGGGGLLLVASGCAADQVAGNAGASSGAAGAKKSSLTFAIPSFPGGWDQDFIGFDLVALALYKNMMLYPIDYSVTTVDGGRIQDTKNIGPTFAESFTADDSGKVWTLKLRR